jgi:16S rRNA (adenine(1408)-N(1))-methyltransferase
VTIDVGTGDGRAVLATAAAEPTTLILGLDAHVASMAGSSRRAAGPAHRGGLANAMFLRAAAEAPPAPLAGIASRVTVRFPWGSLLRGCLGLDPAVAAGIGGLLAPGGELKLLLAPAERDRLTSLPTTTVAVIEAAAAAFAPHGLAVLEARDATADEIRTSHSTWAKRLLAGNRHGTARVDRAVVVVRLRS